METIRLLLYEDTTITRESLVELFDDDQLIDLVGSFANCKNVVKDIEIFNPHIVLMDKDMPGVDGLTGLILIKSSHPEIDVIMYTGMDDDETIFKCLQAGASGYIKKGLPYLQLLEYISIVKNGGTMFSPSIAGKVRDFFLYGPPINEVEFNLTQKEKEALTYLCDGLSQKLIAIQMDISINGVAAHLKNIFRKLQVNSAPEAVAKSIRFRLIDRNKLRFK
jgi:DNA-binding NarL/FixJ family response regulator